ncbi:MAG TPA: hypothetical protein VGN51_20540 [Acidimicrobiia bacterium]
MDSSVQTLDAQDVTDAPSPTGDTARSWTTAMLMVVVTVGVALRAWRLGFNGLSYDESFTAMAARLPLDHLFDYLRTQDSHPPLDYLVRVPLARAGASDVVLRMPSFVFSVVALVLFAWWMRARGVAGVVATALLAASSFQIYHGGEARMYALLELVGLASAMLAERWLGDAAPRWSAWAAGGLVALALFDHVSGFLLAAGMLAVAGLRTDRRAWQWRAGVGGAVVVWATVWGTSFAHQVGGDWAGWIPRTSPSSFARAVSGQITNVKPLVWVMLVAVLAGACCLWRADRRLAHVWIALGAVPFVAAAVIGLASPFLIDRAITVASWAPPLAVGYAAAALVAHWPLPGRAVALALLVVVAIGTISALGERDDADLPIDHLDAVVQPGDVILTRPARYSTLPAYRIGVEEWNEPRWVAMPGIDNASAFRAGDVTPTGRIWLFTPRSFELGFPGYRACPETPDGATAPWSDGLTHIVCLERLS